MFDYLKHLLQTIGNFRITGTVIYLFILLWTIELLSITYFITIFPIFGYICVNYRFKVRGKNILISIENSSTYLYK